MSLSNIKEDAKKREEKGDCKLHVIYWKRVISPIALLKSHFDPHTIENMDVKKLFETIRENILYKTLWNIFTVQCLTQLLDHYPM